MSPSPPVLEIDDREFVRVIRLNRPARKNALNEELGWAIVTAVEEAARDDSGRVRRRFFETRSEHSRSTATTNESSTASEPPHPQEKASSYSPPSTKS